MASFSPTIQELDDLCQRMYSAHEAPVRAAASARLDTLCLGEGNLDGGVYLVMLQQSLNQYSLLFCAQSMIQWFKLHDKSFAHETKGDVINAVIDCTARLIRESAPRHVLTAIMTCVAKLSKLGSEREPLLLGAVHRALAFVERGLQHIMYPGTVVGTLGVSSQSSSHLDGSGGAGDASSRGGRSQSQPPTQVNDAALQGLLGLPSIQLGLQLLNCIVTEFNLYDSSKQTTFMVFSAHRRCSNNFRDNVLMDILVCSLTCLQHVNPAGANELASGLLTAGQLHQQVHGGGGGGGVDSLCGEIVQLVRNCLTYDFMAIIVDETEDALSSQFPTSWKDTLLSSRCIDVLFRQHALLQFPHCNTLLQGIACICGTRRSFFDTSEEKLNFLNQCMTSLCQTEGLEDGRWKHSQYCATMADCILRFVSPFGYKDLSQSPAFERWVRFAERLSQNLFRCMFGQDGSFLATSTMLQFWGRLSNSKRMYLGDEDRVQDLEGIVASLALSFFTSRTTPWQVDFDTELTEAVLTQTDAFPPLVMLSPATTLNMLHQQLQRVGSAVLSTPASLGWLMYLAGSIVRSVFQAVDDSCVEACSFFLLVAVECANMRRTAASSADGSGGGGAGNAAAAAYHDFVECGMLHFLSALQTVFTGNRTSQCVTKVMTNVFESKVKLFHFILYSIGHNITRDPSSSASTAAADTGALGDSVSIVRGSIDLIGESCRDVPAVIMKELRLDLPPVVELPLSQQPSTYKLRTNLVAALWMLRSGGDSYQTEYLLRFLGPIQELMHRSCQLGAMDPLFVAGWLRDLRGVARGTSNNQNAFTDFVDWTLENVSYLTQILQATQQQQQHQSPTPMVVASLLRFLQELVTSSRYGKVNLPTGAHCASGIMLFKFICEMLQNVLAVTITDRQLQLVSTGSIPDDVYRYLLKPLWLSMDVLKKCLLGDFVPFGAMHLYKDDVYDVTMVGMFRMLSVFPPDLFRQYPKAGYAVLDLLRSMTELHVISPLAAMTTDEITRLVEFVVFLCSDSETPTAPLLHGMSFLGFIAQLVGAVKVIVTSPSLSAMDAPPGSAGATSSSLLMLGGGSGSSSSSSCSKMPRSSRRLREAIAKTLAPNMQLWPLLIRTAMNVIVCQDRALSVCCAVVYPIFEADPSFWYQFANEFTATYPERKQANVQAALSELAQGAESQEKFFAEIFQFRNKLRSL